MVNLIGPRQAGKTTLVRDLLGHGHFVTLDDTAVLAAIDAGPVGQLTSLTEDLGGTPLIIDEAQRSRNLALAIKRTFDANRRKGQFVLTGASNVFTNSDVADSLAGRMRTLQLWPLSAAEIKTAPVNRLMDWATQNAPSLAQIADPEPAGRRGYIDLILSGGFPETRILPARVRQRQYRDYVDAVVDRDVADIMPVRKPDALRILIDQMAARTAQETTMSELARLIRLQRVTVEQHLDDLTRLSMVTKLGAWTSGEENGRSSSQNLTSWLQEWPVHCAGSQTRPLPSATRRTPWADCWRASSSASRSAPCRCRMPTTGYIIGAMPIGARPTF